MSEIAAWKEKKASEEANAKYNQKVYKYNIVNPSVNYRNGMYKRNDRRIETNCNI